MNWLVDDRLRREDLGALSALGISASISLPKPVIEFLKNANAEKKNLPIYARELQTQATRATSSIDALTSTLVTVATIGVFGLVIAALLVREKKK